MRDVFACSDGLATTVRLFMVNLPQARGWLGDSPFKEVFLVMLQQTRRK
jgi:hypothetical protein